ncbi:MAG: SpoIIE family protein phosphatase [Spirochaetales bacterium]|nr:SpoIIE family protein phosphatase [Spirochaetales bacterium]
MDYMEKEDCLQKVDQARAYGSSIVRIASGFHYTFIDESVEKLSAAFQQNPDIKAVGVLDNDENPAGIVVKNKLMTLLGRPYAIELFKRKTVKEILQYTDSYYINRNILSVADAIDHKLHDDEISYYLLKNNEGRFAGIFSTRDMINYLSNISKQDIEMARNLQERLVIEDRFFRGDGIDIQGYSRPAKGLGGDFYYVDRIDEKRWIISLCDVSGKGVAASLITTMLWGMMKIYDWNLGLKKFVQLLNENIVQTFHLEKYLTGIFILYDEEKGNFQFCDMGHSLVYLFRGEKMAEIKSPDKNLPIGIETSIEPNVNRLKISKGDRVLLFTDGLIEQQDMNHREFSLDRIAKIMRDNKNATINELKDIMRDRFQTFRKGVSQADDVSFLLIEKL